ncbi:DUF2497 domain-containing protein [Aureimonas sp. ME7]|uniref:PopZ family protein n=1 Tax=Aureimonas sp. ME7 TaxID=2744252 RepID=UPI0015F35B57|nr:DUF2497 domain-containing protein [Aureimonas sp. ME7]
MDEILASIRRIIETGDERSGSGEPNRSSASTAQRRVPAFLADTIAPEPVIDEAGTARAPDAASEASPVDGGVQDQAWPNVYRVEPFRPAGAASVENASASPIEPSHEDAALEAELETELAATWQRIETADERFSIAAMPSAGGSDASLASAPPVEVAGIEPHHAAAADVHHSHGGERDRSVTDVQKEEPVSEPYSERASFHPANTDAVEPQAPAGSSSRYGDTPAPLASRNTGDLVGASFNELAEAIRQGELKSLDEMAREMLQPMLRDWLDDNLPQMVERLVREEIERMARGGKR